MDLIFNPLGLLKAVAKDSYLAQVDSGGADFDIRLELYSVASDSSHTIYGVDAQTIARAGTVSTSFVDFQKVSYVTSTAGFYTFQDYSQAPLISGFTPKNTAGQTTTATVACAASANLPGCGTKLTFIKQ